MKQLGEEKLRQLNQCRYENKLKSYKKHLIKQKVKMDKYFAVNRNLQLIESCNRIGSLRNCLRWAANETKEHILKKLELCMELKFIDHEFLTEARFKTGGRCDVLDLTDGTVYEILYTETDEQFEENKLQKYPAEFRIVKIKCKKEGDKNASL